MTELYFNMDQISSTEVEGIQDKVFIDVISETCFFLPVRLVVNGKDIFRVEKLDTGEIRNWIELPAFSLVLYWKKSLERLDKVGRERIFLADAGEMNIERTNGKVTVMTNFNDVVVTTSYHEFYSSLLKSIESLKSLLKNRFPDLFKREDLGSVLNWQV